MIPFCVLGCTQGLGRPWQSTMRKESALDTLIQQYRIDAEEGQLSRMGFALHNFCFMMAAQPAGDDVDAG